MSTDDLVEAETQKILPIAREQQSLTRQVVDALRHAILTGQFEPGQRLVERMLCEMTGVSRTAIREALRSLEAEGLVENFPNRGPSVASVSLREARDIYSVRLLLEVKAVELFMENMTDDDLAVLEKLMSQMEVAYAEGDFARVNDLKRYYYRHIIDVSGNPIIGRMLQQLYAKIAILRHMTMSQTNRTAAAIIELRAIVAAMKDRNVKAARKACERHIEAAASVATAALARRESGERRA